MEENEKVFVKCKCKINHRRFPSPKKPLNDGDWAVICFQVVETLEGEVKTDYNDCAIFKGNVCQIESNEIYTILAEEVEDDKFGLQYDIHYIGQPATMDTVKEQKIFLSKILTEIQIENIYSTLSNPLEVILEEDLEKLSQVKGIGMATAEKIIDKVINNIDHSKAYIELDGYGLTKNLIDKLVTIYNSPEIAIKNIKENPYKLIEDADGIGFKKADEIALNNGWDENDERRLFYLAQYVLEQEAEKGNSWLYADDFLNKVEQTADFLDEDAFCQIIIDNPKTFYAFDNIYDEDRCIALVKNYNLEKNIARELIRIKNGCNNFDYIGWEEKIKKTEEMQGFKFTDEQMESIEGLIKCNLGVITAGAGCGKTTTVNGLVSVLDNCMLSQTALSGRASARMKEITGEEGYTIHRLLGYNPREGFLYNKHNPLPSDIVIVDEVSMIGGELFYRLVQAIKTGAKLILLGDTGQLEAIGKMNILKDLVDSDIIPTYKLTKIHRQALKSGIIEASMKARNKEQLFDKNYDGAFVVGELQDCFFDVTLNKDDIPSMIKDYFRELIRDNDIKEVQVIVPNNDRGQLSCSSLNPILQDIYNPYKNQKRLLVGEREFRLGDKVINRKNNNKTNNTLGVSTPIFNGDIGIIVDIDIEKRKVLIEFESKGSVWITKKHLPYLFLGYCITTHSSQGSQYNHVIYGLDYGAYTLLNKEQVYTGITRAKKTCTICAETKAYIKAVNTSEINKKQTFLPMLLDYQNDTIEK